MQLETTDDMLNIIDEHLQPFVDQRDKEEEAIKIVVHLQEKYNITSQKILDFYKSILINNEPVVQETYKLHSIQE